MASAALGGSLFAATAEPGELDATTIALGNIVRFPGSFASFSPDGRHLLSTEPPRPVGSVRPSLVLIERSSGRAAPLLRNAYNGAWAPDGSKVAYCEPGRVLIPGVHTEATLSVYDVKSRKRFPLIKVSNCHLAVIAWTKDAAHIVYDFPGRENPPLLIDLDTLQAENAERFWCASNQCDKVSWLRANTFIVMHPMVYFYAERRANEAPGLWVSNRDDSFARRLHPGLFERVWLAPDLSALLFETRNEIHVATITEVQNPPTRIFKSGIRLEALLGTSGLRFWSKAMVEDYLANGAITGEVFDARINPLNARVIGPGTAFKGVVRFHRIDEQRSVVEVIREVSAMRPGDVVTNVRGDHRTPGRGTILVQGVWAELGPLE